MLVTGRVNWEFLKLCLKEPEAVHHLREDGRDEVNLSFKKVIYTLRKWNNDAQDIQSGLSGHVIHFGLKTELKTWPDQHSCGKDGGPSVCRTVCGDSGSSGCLFCRSQACWRPPSI